MDVVALAQHGFANAVATLGTACTPMHVQKLFRHTDAVVFSFDGDAAGRRAARRALEAALPHAGDTRTVRFLFLPPEHDPDSFVRELGSDAFERALANAMPLSTFFLQAIAEGCALGTAEGRAQAVANAKPLLTQLPDGALRLQLLQSVAELARIELRELKRLVYGKGGTFNGQPAAAARAAPVRRAALSAHERAVVSLLAHPAAWHRLETAQQQLLTEGEGPAGMLAQWLATLVERDGLDPAAGIAALQSALDSGRLPAGTERYARQALLESAETGIADALAAVAQLERLMLAEQAKRLAQGGLATAAERETYRELQARLRNLRAMTPSGV
jgi:DNA primase